MKRLRASFAAASAVLACLPATAGAQPWRSIDERQATLEQRIDQGVRSGALTRAEATALRSDFNRLADLESQYRRSGGGLDPRERADLDSRFDRLSQRIVVQKHDQDQRPGRAWRPLSQRQADLDRRLDQGVRDHSLNRREAGLLRAEFNRLLTLETRYRRSGGGLSMAERSDLDLRFDRLSQRIYGERHDRR